MRCFSALRHLIPKTQSAPAYWPGANLDSSFLESSEYLMLSERRMRKLQRFLDSSALAECIIKACASSLPRWKFMHQLECGPEKLTKYSDEGRCEALDSEDDEDYKFVSLPKNLAGVGRARKAFLNEARKIAKCQCQLTEFIINRESRSVSIRLLVWRSISSSAAYLNRRSLPYSSSEWL